MSNVDRTKLNLVLANLVFNATADPTLRANVFSEVYDLLGLRALETDVLLKTNTTPYTPGAGYNPATKKYVDDTTAGVILGQVPDGSITTAKLALDVIAKLNQIYTTERAVANLLARSTIANRTDGASGIIYDLNDGLNTGSAGKIDAITTNVVGTTAIGATTVTVNNVTGFAVGQEVTLFDDVNLERPIISAINTSTKVVTFTAALTKTYKDKAQLCRSSVVQDTTNKLLKFGGWSTGTLVTQTGSTVVASAFDTSGNGGRKVAKTTNGNLFAVMRNGITDFRIMKSTDNGTTTPWPTIVTVTESVNDVALATDGTYLYVLSSVSTTGSILRKYDQSGVLQGSAVNVDSGQTAMGNVSLAIAPDGSLHASWASKNATLPNSFNIRYSKSTDGGVTWAAVTQITTNNTAGTDVTNPSIVVRSNNNPVIVAQTTPTTAYAILAWVYSGTAWTASAGISIYAGATYPQAAPSVAIAPNGRIWVAWRGKDATDTGFYNIRTSYSDDGGVTWSAMEKRTTGNTYNQLEPSIPIDKNNNVHIVWNGITASSAGNVIIRRMSYSGIAWSSITDVTSLTSGSDAVSTLMDSTMDFSEPLMIYRDTTGSTVKFRGSWVITTTTPVLVEDVRYNITPPSNVSSAVAWVDRQTDAGLSLAASLSIHSATESFTAMTKTTSTLDGTTSEDQFTGTGTSNSKATLRVTMTRTSTSITKAETQLTGAVGA